MVLQRAGLGSGTPAEPPVLVSHETSRTCWLARLGAGVAFAHEWCRWCPAVALEVRTPGGGTGAAGAGMRLLHGWRAQQHWPPSCSGFSQLSVSVTRVSRWSVPPWVSSI